MRSEAAENILNFNFPMDRNIKILNIYVNGLSAHRLTELKRFLDNNDIQIICIQETQLTVDILRHIHGYKAEYKYLKSNNINNYGGLVTYFKNGINYKKY